MESDEIGVKNRVRCSNCGYEIATGVIKDDGTRALEVRNDIQLVVIDKERNIGSVKCPKCGFENQTDLSFWRRF
jgi:DNA-directed RNA polymerase subunit RPC12/RpoP